MHTRRYPSVKRGDTELHFITFNSFKKCTFLANISTAMMTDLINPTLNKAQSLLNLSVSYSTYHMLTVVEHSITMRICSNG